MNDLIIWGKIANGDVKAMQILHDRYYYQLWLFAIRFVKDKVIARKLISDCFINLWEQRHNAVIEKSLKFYLFVMLRYQIVDLKQNSRHSVVFAANELPEIADNNLMLEEEHYARIYQAIQRIQVKRRKIIELAVFESYSYSEIASELGISVDTVKTQMGKAYKFLYEELNHNDLFN